MSTQTRNPPGWKQGNSQRSPVVTAALMQLKGTGPGSYEKPPTDLKKQPVYTMRTKLVKLNPSSMHAPSPQNYNVKSDTFDSPGKSFGKILSKPILQGSLGIGPSSGTGSKVKLDDYSFSMGIPLEDINFRKQAYKPGPGQYTSSELTHRDSPTHQLSPAYSISKEFGRGDKKSTKEQSYKPGAGTYVPTFINKRRVSGGGWPTSKRPVVGYTKLVTPGPNAYSLPAKFADMPIHEMKSQAQKDARFV